MTMITDIERGLVARYLVRLLSRQDLTQRAIRGLLVWLNERSDVLTLPMPAPLVESFGGYMAYKPAEFERAWAKYKKEVLLSFERAATETPRPEPLATNAERLVEALGLPHAAWRLIGLFACSSRFEQVQYLANAAADYCGRSSARRRCSATSTRARPRNFLHRAANWSHPACCRCATRV